MSENQGKTVVEIDAEEIKKPGWCTVKHQADSCLDMGE